MITQHLGSNGYLSLIQCAISTLHHSTLCKKRKPAPNKAPKTKTTQESIKNISPAAKNTQKKKSPAGNRPEKKIACAAKQIGFFFCLRRIRTRTIIFAENRCGTGTAWFDKPHHAFGTWGKNWIYEKNVHQRNISPPPCIFYAVYTSVRMNHTHITTTAAVLYF